MWQHVLRVHGLFNLMWLRSFAVSAGLGTSCVPRNHEPNRSTLVRSRNGSYSRMLSAILNDLP
ncbi:hypothetical protein P691DRAFT_142049 [Macrolepiota fuliginosa MF-IS2]|uniref:Secreted protein n=1 Tax=Macrolepiota fuliginosa MF-IS2 TaxID=1400762 RepID=A0A9P5XB81_9AGAR|nr:hypothetical protein P691DRAFT_142049 [Macrolepiota fuliginosa MF-IS2]